MDLTTRITNILNQDVPAMTHTIMTGGEPRDFGREWTEHRRQHFERLAKRVIEEIQKESS